MIDKSQCIDTAKRIVDAFAHQRVPVRIGTIAVLPGFIDYEIRPTLGVSVASIKARRDDVALALGDESVVIRQNGHLSLQCARVPPAAVRAETLMASVMDAPPFTALLGIDEHGDTLTVRITSSEVCHVLIAGTTGSGKTQLARTIVSSLALRHRPFELGLVMIDPKRITSNEFGVGIASHLIAPVAHEAHEAVEVLRRIAGVNGVMEKRTKPEPRIIIYVDEVADLCAQDDRVLALLQRIAARGREAGIHLIACTQKPTAQAVGGLLKANLPLRLIGRVLSATEASTAAGVPDTGAARLSGRGDMLAVAAGRICRFQAALPPPLTSLLDERIKTIKARALTDYEPVVSVYEPREDEAPATYVEPSAATVEQPPAVDDLPARIAEYLRENPGASKNAVSLVVTGKTYGGANYARVSKAYAEALELLASSTSTSSTPENPSPKGVLAGSGVEGAVEEGA